MSTCKAFRRTLTVLAGIGLGLAVGIVVVGCVKMFGLKSPGEKISGGEIVVTVLDIISLLLHLVLLVLRHFPEFSSRYRCCSTLIFGLRVIVKVLLLASIIMVLQWMYTHSHLTGARRASGWLLVGLQIAFLLIGCLTLVLTWCERFMVRRSPILGDKAGGGAGAGHELQVVQPIAHGEGTQI